MNLSTESLKLVAIIIIMILFLCFVLPQMPSMYRKWKNSKSSINFSKFIISFFLLVSVSVIAFSMIIKKIIELNLDVLIVNTLSLALAMFVFIPISFHYFNKFQENKKTLYFSLGFIFALCAVFLMACQFVSLFFTFFFEVIL